jgi:hypothetical protein
VVQFRWDGDLDRRRARARSRATIMFLARVLIHAAYAATLTCIMTIAIVVKERMGTVASVSEFRSCRRGIV